MQYLPYLFNDLLAIRQYIFLMATKMLWYRIPVWVHDDGSGSHPNEIFTVCVHNIGKRELIVYSSVAELKIILSSPAPRSRKSNGGSWIVI
jgi:hypothetical protein